VTLPQQIKRYWDDLVVGERHRSRTRTVSAAEMLDFARLYDPQWFHTDPEAASASPFKGLIGSGIYTCALWRQLDHEICGDIAFICGIAWEDMRFLHPLRPDDAIYVTAEVLEKHESTSHSKRGTAIFGCAVLRSDDVAMLSFRSVNLVHRRP
jgi:acyl dehydratase